jgi:hypothetical protein
VFKMPYPKVPTVVADRLAEDPALWRPPILVCPADFQPKGAHSYLLNKHLVESPTNLMKYSTRPPDGRSSGEVIVTGEKLTAVDDYYMEYGEFDATVDLYRHGPVLGSNYLYKDGHVAATPPKEAKGAIDPWQVISATTQPTSP